MVDYCICVRMEIAYIWKRCNFSAFLQWFEWALKEEAKWRKRSILEPNLHREEWNRISLDFMRRTKNSIIERKKTSQRTFLANCIGDSATIKRKSKSEYLRFAKLQNSPDEWIRFRLRCKNSPYPTENRFGLTNLLL